jgi:hypothetical protein
MRPLQPLKFSGFYQLVAAAPHTTQNLMSQVEGSPQTRNYIDQRVSALDTGRIEDSKIHYAQVKNSLYCISGQTTENFYRQYELPQQNTQFVPAQFVLTFVKALLEKEKPRVIEVPLQQQLETSMNLN